MRHNIFSHFGGSLTNQWSSLINGLPHDKTNKVGCAPSEDSDQPGRLRCVLYGELRTQTFFMHTVKTDQTG